MQDEDEARQDRDFHSPDTRTAGGAPVTSAARARQSVSSGRLLTVLAVALTLVVIGLAASYFGAV